MKRYLIPILVMLVLALSLGGCSDGKEEAYQRGYDAGYQSGYQNGYKAGYEKLRSEEEVAADFAKKLRAFTIRNPLILTNPAYLEALVSELLTQVKVSYDRDSQVYMVTTYGGGLWGFNPITEGITPANDVAQKSFQNLSGLP